MGIRRGACVLVASALIAAMPASAQRRASQPPAGDWMTQAKQTSTLVLQIDRDPSRSDRGMTAQTAAAVCKSSALVDPALVAAFKLPIADVRPLVVVDAQSTADNFLTLTVTVNDPLNRLPADAGARVVDELVRRVGDAFAKSAELQADSLRARRAAIESRVADATKQAAGLDADYARVAPAFDANGSGSSRGASRADLDRQRSTLATQLAGQRARLAAAEQMSRADATRPVGASSQPSDLAAELVELRQGDANADATRRADLIEARLLAALVDALAAMRSGEGRAFTFGPGTLASLRQQVVDLDAQLASLDAQIATLPAATSQPTMSLADFQQLQNDRAEARNRVRQAKSELEQHDRQYADVRPPTLVPITANH